MNNTSLYGDSPSLERWLQEHPHLESELRSVLQAGEALRTLRPGALLGDSFPEPEIDATHRKFRAALDEAVAELESIAARGAEEEATAAVRKWLGAVLNLRAATHQWAPTRGTSSPATRAALFEALELFNSSWKNLKRAADKTHVPRLPWRIPFSSHLAPEEPMRAVELTGYDLPAVPVSSFPWGERCFLTGTTFHKDSNRLPQTRYRSLDSCNTVLTPEAFEIVQRSRRALASIARFSHRIASQVPQEGGTERGLEPDWGAEIRRVVQAMPHLFEDFVPEDCSAAFAKLGLADFPSLAVTLNNALTRFSRRPFLGAYGVDGEFPTLGGRDRTAAILQQNDRSNGFGWLSFGEARRRALHLAHALEGLGLGAGARIGVLANQSTVDHYLIDFACVFSNLVSVGLHHGFADQTLAEIIRSTELSAVFCRVKSARELVEGGLDQGTILVMMGAPAGLEGDPIEGVRTVFFKDLIDTGNKPLESWTSRSGIGPATGLIHDDVPGWKAARQNRIQPDTDNEDYTVIFTSGSTGTPKGYPVTRRRWREGMEYGANVWPYVVVSYQPFALAADRKAVWQVLLNGGRVGFARPGAHLFDDIRAIRPTYFEGPPAIWNVVADQYRSEVTRVGADPKARAQVALRLQDVLGGRLSAMAVGGAPSDKALRHTIEEIFSLPMGEGYGTTETGAIAQNGKLLKHLDFRLLDVPDLGLSNRDRPYPRGELAVRPPTGSSEYLADERASEDRFTKNGYFRTGDLVEIHPDGSYRMLGRHAEAFKLAGGEFVAPARLEELYRLAPLVDQVFATTNGPDGTLVAVVVPSRSGVWGGEVLAELRQMAPHVGLRPFEVPAAVVLDSRREDGGLPWTPDNGLLTKSWKLDRRALARRFSDAIRDAVAGGGDDVAWVASAAEPPPGQSAEAWRQTVARQAAEVLGLEPNAIDLGRTFVDHGGGSLTSIQLLLRLEGLSGSPLSAAQIGMEELTLEDVAERVRQLARGPRQPSSAHETAVAQVMEPPPTRARSTGVTGLIAADVLQSPLLTTPHEHATGFDTLVTGATGFVGTHLVAELTRSLPKEATIFALVRAKDHRAARDRLSEAMNRVGENEERISAIDEVRRGRVVAFAGSLNRPRLGIEDDLWRQLSGRLAQVIHSGAEVRHDAGYEKLRATNVEGTRRVLDLALADRMKAFHLVSSLDVTHLISRQRQEPPSETAPLPGELSDRVLATSSGYAVSKWAAEKLVERAWRHSDGRFSASISRPALVSWSSLSGAANRTDWLTCFLISCLQMGCLPCQDEAGVTSWVPLTPSSARGIDLVPVDFVARAVAQLTELTRSGVPLQPTSPPSPGQVPTFHISNPNPGSSGFVTWPHLLQTLAAAHFHHAGHGEPLRPVPLRRWRLRVTAAGAPFAPLLSVLGNLPALPRMDAGRLLAITARGHGRDPLACPPFSIELMQRFIQAQLITPSGGERGLQTTRQAP
ncbi:MAG: SDR family oxidoreductase [Thermoanaerobaculales bacterium]